MSIRSYKDLLVWQKAIELTTLCYKVTSGFPKDETYGLTSQIRRASVSIAANIAEGYGRDQTGSFLQFLRIAQGSNRELETHAIIARNVGVMDGDIESDISSRCDEISRMMRSLIRSIEAGRGDNHGSR